VGVALAELLGLPHATIVVAVELQQGRVRAKRELEGGWFQWTTMPTPAVLTIQSGINQLRYATLKGIMAAKHKPVRVHAAAATTPVLRIRALSPPDRSRHTRMLEGPAASAAAALVHALRSEGLL
jgi:electron transfer flavoprotein beta subunit